MVHFIDPNPVTCPSCGKDGEYKVSDLLEYQASCQHCGVSLASIGQQMKELLEYETRMFLLVELVLHVEQRINVQIDDADLQPMLANRAAKVADFLKMTKLKLATGHSEEVTSQIYEAIAGIGGIPVDQLTSSMSLSDALGVD